MQVRELQVSYVNHGRRDEAQTLRTGREIASLMAPVLESEVVEVCYVLCLTVRLRLIGYYQVSRGCVSSTPTQPREVFQAALLANAAGIVLVHNHPSGDPNPSIDDISVTRAMKSAGELLGIELLDHVIIGHQGRYVSLKEMGRL